MFRYFAATAAVYGIGFVAVAVERASAHWDKMGTSSLLQDAIAYAAVWPGQLVHYFV